MRTICNAQRGLQLIAKQWTLHIIKRLEMSPARYKDLLSSALISGKVLSSRLKELNSAGLIQKQQLYYGLTPKGQEIAKLLMSFELLFDRE